MTARWRPKSQKQILNLREDEGIQTEPLKYAFTLQLFFIKQVLVVQSFRLLSPIHRPLFPINFMLSLDIITLMMMMKMKRKKNHRRVPQRQMTRKVKQQ